MSVSHKDEAMSDELLKKVQAVELEILIQFDKVCRDYGLTYFLDSGTLLGAVRHGGFIPWDDDIDVSMMRDDYEKFLKVGQAALGDDFFLQTRETDPEYPCSFAKIKKNDTTFLEWDKRNLNMHHGIWIDIFVYDNLPDEDEESYMNECLALDKKLLLNRMPDRAMHPQLSLKWLIGAIVRRGLHYLTRITNPIKSLDKRIDETFKRYWKSNPNSEFVACHSFGGFYKFRRNSLLPAVPVTFEGHEFLGPARYKDLLEQLYGDYMKLPPEEERIGHKPMEVSFNSEYRPSK